MIDYWGELVYRESRFRVAEENTEGCFSGRVAAGECWPVIKLLGRLDQSLPTSLFASFEHNVCIDSVPEKYKNGEPFYFTVKSIDLNKLI